MATVGYDDVCATVALRLSEHDRRAEDQWARLQQTRIAKYGKLEPSHTHSDNTTENGDGGTDTRSHAPPLPDFREMGGVQRAHQRKEHRVKNIKAPDTGTHKPHQRRLMPQRFAEGLPPPPGLPPLPPKPVDEDRWNNEEDCDYTTVFKNCCKDIDADEWDHEATTACASAEDTFSGEDSDDTEWDIDPEAQQILDDMTKRRSPKSERGKKTRAKQHTIFNDHRLVVLMHHLVVSFGENSVMEV